MVTSGVRALSPPGYFTRFIGRVGECGLLRELVAGVAATQSRRLLTLVGRGGDGKTRLASELARALVAETRSSSSALDRVVWAEVGPLSDASQLPHAVAAAVGLPHAGGADLIRALTRFLASRRQLRGQARAHLTQGELGAATLLGAARAWVDAFGPSSLAGAHGDRVSTERHVRTQIGDEYFVAAVAAGLGLDAARTRAEAEQAVDELASLCRRLPWGMTEREVQVLRWLPRA